MRSGQWQRSTCMSSALWMCGFGDTQGFVVASRSSHMGAVGSYDHSRNFPVIPDLEGKKAKVKSLSHVRLFATPWTVAHQALPSMGLSRQGYWSGLPFPSPGDLPDPGIEPRSPAVQADTLPPEPPGKLQSNSLVASEEAKRQLWSP